MIRFLFPTFTLHTPYTHHSLHPTNDLYTITLFSFVSLLLHTTAYQKTLPLRILFAIYFLSFPALLAVAVSFSSSTHHRRSLPHSAVYTRRRRHRKRDSFIFGFAKLVSFPFFLSSPLFSFPLHLDSLLPFSHSYLFLRCPSDRSFN